MTIETQQSKIQYQGNGTTTVFPLPFPVLRAEHVQVWVSTGGAGQQVTTGFSVVGTLPTGASVQFAVAPAAGELITLARVVPFVQQTALRDGSNFSATVVEGTFDGQEMQVQQLAEGLDRAIKLDIASDKTPEELLDSIYTAQADAKGAATAASAAQGAAENAASRARASEVLAGQAKEEACACADIAEAAKDVAIAQAEATNVLMAAEVGKINAIIADNKQGQMAVVDAARAWAETPHGVPVDVDEDGNPVYSAKHFAAEAQSISIPAATEITAGVVRLGTTEDHKAGAKGVAAQCSEVKEMLALKNPTQELLTVSGAWVAPTNGIYQIELQGGGGGGGGCVSYGSLAAGASGAAGLYKMFFRHYNAGDSVNFTIGAGGAGGTSSTASASLGVTGGDTKFDDLIALGGGAGTAANSSSFTGGSWFNCGMSPASDAKTVTKIISVVNGAVTYAVGGAPSTGNINQVRYGQVGWGQSGGGATALVPHATDFGAGGGAGIVFGAGSNLPGAAGRQGCVRITLLVAFGE